MPVISEQAIQTYRAQTFRTRPGLQISTPEEARQFVQERGFIYFWPINGIVLPNLWAAVAGSRPVASQHDDPGHITWGWKDEALGQQIWYYAKVLRKKATLIDLTVAPYFYALSENYGDPAEGAKGLVSPAALPKPAQIRIRTSLASLPVLEPSDGTVFAIIRPRRGVENTASRPEACKPKPP